MYFLNPGNDDFTHLEGLQNKQKKFNKRAELPKQPHHTPPKHRLQKRAETEVFSAAFRSQGFHLEKLLRGRVLQLRICFFKKVPCLPLVSWEEELIDPRQGSDSLPRSRIGGLSGGTGPTVLRVEGALQP